MSDSSRRVTDPDSWTSDPLNLRRISVLACVLLVTLRLFLGWQFLYEGLWKIDTLETPAPWTSAGFLRNAQGPFRDTFREMSGDPDDLKWLDYDTVLGRWKADAARFEAHHPDLTDRQRRQIASLLEGDADYRAVLQELPPGTEIPEELRSFVRFEPQMQRIIVDGRKRLTARERDELLALADATGEPVLEPANPQSPDSQNLNSWELAQEYKDAIQRVWQRASRLSYSERLRVLLGADPDLPRVRFGSFSGSFWSDQAPDVDVYYRQMLKQYRDQVESAEIDYERQHADVLWGELQELRADLVNPVKSLEAQFKSDLNDVLTFEQRRAGPPPEPWTAVRIADTLTITGLTTLGCLLIIGFLTRLSAAAGGVMILSFYLVWPPWPGVPEAPGPEHALVVNKNLIEVAALFALAALPTGRWFGVDGILHALFHRFWSSRRRPAVVRESVPRPAARDSAPADVAVTPPPKSAAKSGATRGG